MQIKIDVKSLVVGLVLGVVVLLAMGQVYSGAGVSDFGLTVDRSGFAIVRDKANIVYVVDPQREKARIIQYDNGPYKGRFMDLDVNLSVEKKK
jgi:hypothetical protein